MTRKSDDYYIGRGMEDERRSAKASASAASDAHPTVVDLATSVMKQLRRDDARKQEILQRSPHLGHALDAETYQGMSARELAQRELSELGVEPDGRSVEEQLLDAHHRGRAYARGERIPGNKLKGGNEVAMPGNKLIGSANDSAGDSFIDHYLNGTQQETHESAIDAYLNFKE